MIPAELQQPILDRAGGNPLVCRRVRAALEGQRAAGARRGRAGSCERGREVPFPESVRALIAARLDTLTPDAKSLLADAAVVGKVFWVGRGGRRWAIARPMRWCRGFATSCRAKSLSVRPDSHRCRARPNMRFGTSSPVTSPMHSSRARRGPRDIAAAAWIESQAPPAGRRRRRRACLPLRNRARPGPRHRRKQPGRRTRGAGPAVPHPRRRTRAWPRHRCGARPISSGRLRSPHRRHPDRPAALVRFAEAAFHAGAPTRCQAGCWKRQSAPSAAR